MEGNGEFAAECRHTTGDIRHGSRHGPVHLQEAIEGANRVKVGLFFWGTVWMAEAGHGAPDPYSHQFPPEAYAGAFYDLLEWAKLADQAGFESFWVTEHHFQREGYQVVPNVLLTSAVMAQHTRHLRFGAMVHPIPTWHPLRFAEDFAIADILT